MSVKTKKLPPATPDQKHTTMRVWPKTVDIVRKLTGFANGKPYADVLHDLVETEGNRRLRKLLTKKAS